MRVANNVRIRDLASLKVEYNIAIKRNIKVNRAGRKFIGRPNSPKLFFNSA